MDDAVVASAARLPCLRDLGVRYCQAVSDAGMTALAATRPELEALAIDECGKVTDAGLAAISSQCKQLRVGWGVGASSGVRGGCGTVRGVARGRPCALVRARKDLGVLCCMCHPQPVVTHMRAHT